MIFVGQRPSAMRRDVVIAETTNKARARSSVSAIRSTGSFTTKAPVRWSRRSTARTNQGAAADQEDPADRHAEPDMARLERGVVREASLPASGMYRFRCAHDDVRDKGCMLQ